MTRPLFVHSGGASAETELKVSLNATVDWPGSARVSRAGDCVLAMANFSCDLFPASANELSKRRLFRRDAETNTRDACATQSLANPRDVTKLSGR